MTNVALLGYGRFGAALASLFADADLAVRAFDPVADVPDAIREDSLPALVAAADIVLVAVPVPAMREAFEALRPLLRPSQIVADVGSVKVEPARMMAEVFGGAIPWVATHPLFGPVSLARGERPLVAVVCPNAEHPYAEQGVAALYERIGCTVVRQDAAAHDRAMADTHALAFFVAKGMLDAGVPVDAPHAPPSFQALARMVTAARSDAGHLYATLHRDNPFAAEARTRLLDALTAADRALSPSSAALGPAAPPPVLPSSGERSADLREARELIDELDRAIVDLFAQRAELARRAAREKARMGRPVRDPAREAELFAARRRWAEERGLDPEAMSRIFAAILDFSRRVQEAPPGADR